jgi:hypothetical protein
LYIPYIGKIGTGGCWEEGLLEYIDLFSLRNGFVVQSGDDGLRYLAVDVFLDLPD